MAQWKAWRTGFHYADGRIIQLIAAFKRFRAAKQRESSRRNQREETLQALTSLLTCVTLRLEVPLGSLRLHVGDATDLPNGDREIRPPPVPMFDQVLSVLDAMPPSRRSAQPSAPRAAAAVCLRWGTYLALLMDDTRPIAAFASDPKVSRLRNAEMTRIHIEATANLERWIRLSHEDPKRYHTLVVAAQQLPLPRTSAPTASGILQLIIGPQAELLHTYLTKSAPERLDLVKAAPTRSFANALFYMGWRNGPIEDLHAGKVVDADFSHRRFTSDETEVLMDCAVSGFAAALEASKALAHTWNTPKFAEAIAPLTISVPAQWTLTESSCPVLLRRVS